jgi:hypothetical protein
VPRAALADESRFTVRAGWGPHPGHAVFAGTPQKTARKTRIRTFPSPADRLHGLRSPPDPAAPRAARSRRCVARAACFGASSSFLPCAALCGYLGYRSWEGASLSDTLMVGPVVPTLLGSFGIGSRWEAKRFRRTRRRKGAYRIDEHHLQDRSHPGTTARVFN